MTLLPFDDLPVWTNLVDFTAAAVVVWLAGTRLSSSAEVIAKRTGLGQAFIGALLLGGITSLPEGATTVSASAIGNAPLAVNNLFGGVAMQVAILAAADAYLGGPALSTRVQQPSVLLQGTLLILMLSLAALGIAAGDVLVLGVGIWTFAIFLTAIMAFYLVHRHHQRDTWEVEAAVSEASLAPGESTGPASPTARTPSLRRAVLSTIVAGVVILAAGFVLAQVGDVLAEQTGLEASFVGAVLVAVSTSLPEVSTTLGAVRLGAYAMAFSGIFGTNVLDTAILFLADVVYTGGPVLAEVGRFSIVAAMLGILLTAIYIVGILERRETVVLRMGLDSLLVLVLYIGGLVVLYFVR
jgi:cation:H+ antiporter